jgi:uncharacterized membrane protein YfcA
VFNLLEIGLLACGAMLAGFVAGLTGFGTAMTAMAFWLYVIPPVVAAPLVAICAVGAHVMSARKIFQGFDFGATKPLLIGGLLGVPIGIALISWLSPDLVKGVMGLFLASYALVMLVMKAPPIIAGGGRVADGVVGLIGGVLGGFAGLSGPVPTIWSLLRGWDKDHQRRIIQGFNMLILAFAIAVFAIKGMLTVNVLTASMICLPATFFGSWLGTRAYFSLDPAMFQRVVLSLVFVSGLVLSTIWLWG